VAEQDGRGVAADRVAHVVARSLGLVSAPLGYVNGTNRIVRAAVPASIEETLRALTHPGRRPSPGALHDALAGQASLTRTLFSGDFDNYHRSHVIV